MALPKNSIQKLATQTRVLTVSYPHSPAAEYTTVQTYKQTYNTLRMSHITIVYKEFGDVQTIIVTENTTLGGLCQAILDQNSLRYGKLCQIYTHRMPIFNTEDTKKYMLKNLYLTFW